MASTSTYSQYAAQQAQQPKAPREFDNRELEASLAYSHGAIGGGATLEAKQAAVPRALEAQAFAGKRLAEVVHELLARLEPVLGADLANQAAQGKGVGGSCALAATLDLHTAEVQQATDVLRSVLRRLAL